MPYKASGRENRMMPKRPRPTMGETDCNLVHCPTVGNTHWMFRPLSAGVVNQLADFSHLAALEILS